MAASSRLRQAAAGLEEERGGGVMSSYTAPCWRCADVHDEAVMNFQTMIMVCKQ